MSILTFDKENLGNLEYSLQREMLSTNRTGGYRSTTIICCNTRKYHGLIVCPISEDDERNYVLLSSLDETVLQQGQAFNLAIHRFPGNYEPRGHKYITDFAYTPLPTLTYRVGGVVLRKEMLWIHSGTQMIFRYTLLEAKSPTKLRLRPFFAYRDVHSLAQANLAADPHSYPVPNGMRNRLYEGFPSLYSQTSKPCTFVPAPDWYRNFEYAEEAKRGYPCHEDLLTTGYFELDIQKGESIYFSCGTAEADPATLAERFEQEKASREEKNDFITCIRHAARQFIVRRGDKTEVAAGYPWFGRWGRDTFIALPGITLSKGEVDTCKAVIDTLTSEMQDGLFPNMGSAYNSVDAPLWFFWTLQQLAREVGDKEVWERYGEKMKDVLNAYRRGVGGVIAMHSNGLIWASNPNLAMTWMDAVVDGKPVTGRDGYQVEINALWYNALCYTLKLAGEFGDKAFVKSWAGVPEQVKESFLATFWFDKEHYLADYVDTKEKNWYIRPNQIIACSLPYCMLSQDQVMAVVAIVKQHLLTPKGLRTLSPRNIHYEGRYGGDQPTRDRQYHQGTVWPWLLEHYVKACFDLYGKNFADEAREMLSFFEEDVASYGIGSICEIYDGDPPHIQRGSPFQAWSVGAVLNIHRMIEETKQ